MRNLADRLKNDDANQSARQSEEARTIIGVVCDHARAVRSPEQTGGTERRAAEEDPEEEIRDAVTSRSCPRSAETPEDA